MMPNIIHTAAQVAVEFLWFVVVTLSLFTIIALSSVITWGAP